MNDLRPTKTDHVSDCHPIGRNLTRIPISVPHSRNPMLPTHQIEQKWSVQYLHRRSRHFQFVRYECEPIQSSPPSSIIGFNGGDTNLYGYVINDPINLVDPSGNCPWCIGAAVGGIASGASAYLAGGDISTIAISATIGAAAGAASMGASALATSAVGVVSTNSAIGVISNVTTQLATGAELRKLNRTSVLVGGLSGAVGGLVGLGAGNAAFFNTPVLGNPIGLALARSREFLSSLLVGAAAGSAVEVGAEHTCR